MSWRKRKTGDVVVVDASTLTIPSMLREEMVLQVQRAHTGAALAMLVYTEQSYEVVSGPWTVFVDTTGSRTYWVADRVVAVDDEAGEPMPVPSLVHLHVNGTLDVGRLMREQIRAA